MKLKLTEEMHLELRRIQSRIRALKEEFDHERFDYQISYQRHFNPLRTIFKDELESYKIKLENFYCDTDMKEQLRKK